MKQKYAPTPAMGGTTPGTWMSRTKTYQSWGGQGIGFATDPSSFHPPLIGVVCDWVSAGWEALGLASREHWVILGSDRLPEA
jgi:hypothetical protein